MVSLRKKRKLILDPVDDNLMCQLFNDMINQGYASYDYTDKKEKWHTATKKIGMKTKTLIDEDFLFPTSVSRHHNLGFILKPKNIEVNKEPFGDKLKFVFTRKIF